MSTAREHDAARPARRHRQRVIVVAGAVLVAAAVFGAALYGRDDAQPAPGLTVGWGGSEGHPSCVYDPKDSTVEAKITIAGEAPRHDGTTVTVTVTAHADENTSEPVGSSTRRVRVAGTVHLPLLVTIPVEKSPHVDIDGETACTLAAVVEAGQATKRITTSATQTGLSAASQTTDTRTVTCVAPVRG